MKKLIVIILLIMSLFSTTQGVYAKDTNTTPSGIAFSDIPQYIDDYMAQYIGITLPGAAIVLVKDGQIIFSKGYGYSNIEENMLVDSRKTVFEYGSISKIFVYTTIMSLVEQGKINLDSDIRDYLPENFLRKINFDNPITMLNIMNHTTGFEDFLFDVILLSPDNLTSMEQTLRLAQPEQVYEPGTVVAYSNYAVALAAYIAEKQIGQDFYKYLMDHVFVPLRMDNTSAHVVFDDRPILFDNKAQGYRSNNKGGFEEGAWSYVPLYPIGGINGTAEDLARFAIALLPEEGKSSPLFKKRATLDEMFTQSFAIGPGLNGFAHGFIEFESEHHTVGHGGNTAFFSSQINLVPDERFGVIILTNVANEMHVTTGLTEALIGKPKQSIKTHEKDLPDVSEVAGTYVAARRMQSGFLEFYAYLSLLNVKVIDQNRIELKMFGETSTMIQTQPYVFERIESNGPIFQYHFNPVYFEMNDGKVMRLSGDFVPLPYNRSLNWLIFTFLFTLVFSIFMLISFVTLLISKKYRLSFSSSIFLLVVSGISILINNVLIILRMLINNYRSFVEFRIQILLNYPLVLFVGLFTILSIINWHRSNLSRRFKLFSLILIITLSLFIGILIDWQFFKLLY